MSADAARCALEDEDFPFEALSEVCEALSDHDRPAVLRTFRAIERDVSGEIRKFYQTKLPDGAVADVLYYFWVKQAECPSCASAIAFTQSSS
ncbi:MAG TPA: hypothetical protein VHX61_19580 [Rhizomicrobium sp.]|nr:hypothetical protein [Rhizomicrobium sp.]